MKKITVLPENTEQKNAVLEFLKSQKIKFEEIVDKTQERLYDADFIESMELSFKEVMGDKISMRKFSI
jgi:uncharacterized membrane protein YcgQ (UPF0703/DUF1980 family)